MLMPVGSSPLVSQESMFHAAVSYSIMIFAIVAARRLLVKFFRRRMRNRIPPTNPSNFMRFQVTIGDAFPPHRAFGRRCDKPTLPPFALYRILLPVSFLL